MSSDIKNIIFDWSGTLSDDIHSVYQAVSIIFKRMGKEPISFDQLREEMVLPYMKFWNAHFPDMTKEVQDEMFKKAINEVDSPTIYPGVKDELIRLDELGIKKIVISSHVHDNLLKEAESYGVGEYFQELNGGVEDKEKVIEEILERNDFDPDETMYVGDMRHDITAGKEAGVVTTAITWGYKPAKILREVNPDYIINDISEIEELVS